MTTTLRLLPIAALLTACGSSKPTPDPRVEVLEQRLAEQTHRIDALEAARQREVMDAANKAAPSAQPPANEFVLIGAGTLGQDGKRYPSEQECEAAKKTVAESAGRLEKEARAKGAAFVMPAAMSCLPTPPELIQPSFPGLRE
ncbi:hypothetical protein ACT009_11625 [Sphingomonas sp. Tas61C01]|uniref:hypothetical protein n=1 Tax=Sphingomonas sp. Tas61C01 TaxID=3458297 RepID=UPI00403EAC40